MEFLLLLMLGIAAGIVNSVAAGAGIFLYPILLGLGLKPVTATATMGLAIWPGALSSVYGYSESIKKIPHTFFLLLMPGVLGGGIGAYLLGHTSNNTFRNIAPWLLLFAAALICLHSKIHALFNLKVSKRIESNHPLIILVVIGTSMLALGIYSGYFAVGAGIIFLAILSLTPLKNINQINGLKNLLSITTSLLIIPYFMLHHLVDWRVLPALGCGGLIGGWLGSTYGHRLPASTIRIVTAIAAVVISVGLLAGAK